MWLPRVRRGSLLGFGGGGGRRLLAVLAMLGFSPTTIGEKSEVLVKLHNKIEEEDNGTQVEYNHCVK